jgi:hypothetical protein
MPYIADGRNRQQSPQAIDGLPQNFPSAYLLIARERTLANTGLGVTLCKHL